MIGKLAGMGASALGFYKSYYLHSDTQQPCYEFATCIGNAFILISQNLADSTTASSMCHKESYKLAKAFAANRYNTELKELMNMCINRPRYQYTGMVVCGIAFLAFTYNALLEADARIKLHRA